MPVVGALCAFERLDDAGGDVATGDVVVLRFARLDSHEDAQNKENDGDLNGRVYI